MFSKSISFVILTALATSIVNAQDPTDLYLFKLHRTDDRQYHIYQPQFLSAFNPGGYTNQPWFTLSGDLLFSVCKKDEKQSDIYQLTLRTKKIKRLTQTK